MKLSNRRGRGVAAVATIVLLVAGLVTACGSSKDQAPQTESVTISHKFGETKVPANPSRVATVRD